MDTFYYSDNLKEGLVIDITDDNEVRHALKSLRKQVGDEVRVVNGKGQAFYAEITETLKKSFKIKLLSEDCKETEYKRRLFIAIGLLNKQNKFKLIAEKLTELGVSGIIPFITERTQFPDKKVGDLKSVAVSAIKQCGGKKLPEIFDTTDVNGLVSLAMKFDKKYFCHPEGESISSIDYREEDILLVIGPEGGFTCEEVKFFENADFERIGLGKRILRTETAALSAAALFLIK